MFSGAGAPWAGGPPGSGADNGSVWCDYTQTLYAATLSGVFKSIDAAMSWQPASTGLEQSGGIFALAINPSAPQTLYAATGAGAGGLAAGARTGGPAGAGSGFFCPVM